MLPTHVVNKHGSIDGFFVCCAFDSIDDWLVHRGNVNAPDATRPAFRCEYLSSPKRRETDETITVRLRHESAKRIAAKMANRRLPAVAYFHHF